MNEMLARLNNKYSQQSTWNEYVEIIGISLKPRLAESSGTEVTSILSCADLANNFSMSLARISKATHKLQSMLNEDEKKILHYLNFEWVKLNYQILMHGDCTLIES